MSSYDYLTGAVSDPYDNVGKVRKQGAKGLGQMNPNSYNYQSQNTSINDLLNPDISPY